MEDDWDSDFTGVSGTPFADWPSAERAARSIAPGYRAYMDDATGANVLRVVHHPETVHYPW